MKLLFWPVAALATLAAAACTPAAVAPEPGAQVAQSTSILASSSPTNGSSVAGPVRRIDLNFNPPARLGEVTVTGPGGMMPMMVSAVGEVAHYELPLSSDLGPGAYRVDWKASIASAPYHGSFAFTVR